MKVYTKTGDRGVTSLYDGTRVQKSEQIFDVLGTLDELGSHIGVLLSHMQQASPFLLCVQRTLLNIGSVIATPSGDVDIHRVTETDIECIEKEIDNLDTHMEELKTFLIMDGGSATSAQSHVCRTVCRRLEREMEKYGNIDRTITRYINRLSDYFFTLARFENLPERNTNYKYTCNIM